MTTAPKKCLLSSFLVVAFASALGQTPGQSPLIQVLDPVANTTYTDAVEAATVHLRPDADVASFQAQINGVDITRKFEQTSTCQSGVCNLRADLPANLLLHGTNALSVEVNGPDDTSADDVVKFQYQAPEVQDAPVSRLTPAVAVTSVQLRGGGSPTDYRSYEIVVGPGPDFPRTVYSASDLSCPNGIDSVQVLILQRQTLTPERQNSRECFGTAQALTTFLKAAPRGDLVILNNFLGRMANIDTTAIGGTNYSGSQVDTRYYNAIGLAGAPAGAAFESYQPNQSHEPRVGINALPALNGSLMLDIDTNYYFVPKDFPELKVTAGTGDSCATVTFDGHSLRHCLWADSQGGFWIVAIDRRLGIITDSYDFLKTNSNDPQVRKRSIDEVAALLDNYYKSNDLVVVTTLGIPFRSSTEVNQGLWNTIFRLGGNGFVLPQLTTAGSGYALASSPDPDYVAANYARESTTSRSGENATLDLVFRRDRFNRFVLYQDFPLQGEPAFADNEWPKTLFAPPIGWPAWTPAQEKAYEDLTKPSEYPVLTDALGCSRSCAPFRDWYDDGISTCSAPTFLGFNLKSLEYVENPVYGRADFDAVTKQLGIEQGYEGRIYNLCAQVRDLTTNQKDTLKRQLKAVGNTINDSLLAGAKTAQMQVAQLSAYSKYANVGSSIPYFGAAFSAVSATLGAAATLIPAEDGVPGQFAYTLDQLNEQIDTEFGPKMSLLVTTIFSNISDDWGKLSTIGPAIGDRESPWYFCRTCTTGLPINSLPVVGLGAKRLYYNKLLPTAYSTDFFAQQTNPDPKPIVRYVLSYLDYVCYRPYQDAPQQSIWTYPSINQPSTWDIYILTQTQKVKVLGYDQLRFPSTGLLSDLLDAPVIDPRAVTLTGGAGLIQDDFLRFGTALPRRPGYPGTSAGCRTQ